eukprot:gene21135-21925_t
MAQHRIGIIGLGKITQDQHIPAIHSNPAFALTAVSSQRGLSVAGAKHAVKEYIDLLALDDVDAVAICTPPQVRYVIARDALAAGKHVLLEKPPGATISELVDLKARAAAAGLTLFTTWHSQYNSAVDMAAAFLKDRQVKRLLVTWKEDVRHWHPGQTWIWQAGGFGVFDPGINALSIVSKIMPEPVIIAKADLEFPSNCDAPIAARLVFANNRPGQDMSAVFDFLQTGPQTWNIDIETGDGATLTLSFGGTRLEINGAEVVAEKMAEYEAIYARFATLLDSRTSLVDETPLRLVADAFLVGRRIEVAPFIE